jgi:SAM-dependent methyltransferase
MTSDEQRRREGQGPHEEEARVAALYDGVADLYELLYPSLHAYGPRVAAFLADALGGAVRPGCSVLDVGCGGGQLTRGLPPGVHVVGLDVSERMLAVARAGRPEGDYLLHSFAEPLPAPLHGTFDVLLAAGCLDFCHDLPATVGHLARALRPGGRLLLSVLEQRADLPGHGEARRTLAGTEPPVVLHFWPPAACAGALAAAGLAVRAHASAPAFEVRAEGLHLHYGWWEAAREG